MTPASTLVRGNSALDTIVQGDCIKVMSRMASAAVDFVLTDPPLHRALSLAHGPERDQRR
jgi:DNA modification methylase